MAGGPKKPISFIQQTAMMIGPLSDATALETKHFFLKNHFEDFVTSSSFASSADKTGFTSSRDVATVPWNKPFLEHDSISYFTYQSYSLTAT